VLRLALLCIVLLASANAFAFPELVRRGYTNCVSCHVSPTGGGLLTDYGRSLSRELLSTWGAEGEERFAYGLVKPPSWLRLGGDFYGLEYGSEELDGTYPSSFVLMQADLEAAVTLGNWTADATLGRLDTAIFQGQSDWISRRHYLRFKPRDELSIRAGRFLPAFGILFPDHAIAVREGLDLFDLGRNEETYNLEASWLGEKLNAYATANFGRPDNASLERESGAIATVSTMLGDTYKVGASYDYGTSDLLRRHVFGPWVILGFTPGLSILGELDFQRAFAAGTPAASWGMADYLKLDFEPLRGVRVFGTQQFARFDFGSDKSREITWGLGAQFFPRPHLDLQADWEARQNLSFSPYFLNVFFLVLHYYL
jgi:hypothetical protein